MQNRDDLVDELAKVAESEIRLKDFYQQVLPRVASHLGSAGTAVWICGDDSIELFGQQGLDGSLVRDETELARHKTLLAKVQKAGQPAYVLPKTADDMSARANPTDYLLGICPVKVDEEVVALLESFHAKDNQPGDRDASLRTLRAVAGVAGRFHRDAELRQLRQGREWWQRFEAFSRAAHASLNPTKTAYAIANEGRLVVGCDRFSVLLRRGRKCRAVAISGQDSINRRANAIVLLQQMASRVMAIGEAFHYPTDNELVPPQLEEAVDAYVDNSQTRYLTVVPLVEEQADENDETSESRPLKRNVIGALVAEQFAGEPISRDLVEAIRPQASSALGNALEHHRIFLLPLWVAIGKLSWLVKARNLPKTLFAALLLTAVVAALVLVRVDFEMTAEGTLQPEVRRYVFAQAEGVVDQLLVHHGSKVSAGDDLAKIRSSEIDLQLIEIRGELETTSKKLVATKAGRVAASSVPGTDRARLNQLAAEEEELRRWLVSLQNQQQLLLDRETDLHVHSPIDGEVITWDVENQLTSRPVAKGDVLVMVAQTEGPWVLELLLPDNRVGHVRTAQQELKPELDVTFILATNPAEELAGTVQRVARSTIVDQTEGLVLPVTVEINEADIARLRPGAKVVAKINCGRRAVGYVWLHELFEFFQSRVLFRL